MKHTLTLASCLIMTALLHAQTTIYVAPTGTGAGTSWANACNLEKAVADASAPLSDRAEIWVQKGTYYPTKMLVIAPSVKIYGGFSGTETALSQRNFSANPTIIDGQQKIGSIFRLENSAEINGFTIQNGNANGNSQKSGGGIWADENCIIENCVITKNTATFNGGGVYANGKVKIINSTIENNAANGNGNDMFGNCMNVVSNQTRTSPNDIAGCNPSILYLGEVSFKSDQTWFVTDDVNDIHQEWSDVVMAEGCNKTTYYGGASGSYYSDCRANSNRTTYGDLFSWCAVARFAHVLCPAPWRAPTVEDFGNLDKAMGGYGDGFGPGTTSMSAANGRVYTNATIVGKYTNSWGRLYGGFCGVTGTLQYQGRIADYWAQSENNVDRGFYSGTDSNSICPQCYAEKFLGVMLRCVR